jgi:hypothetical protein
MKKRKQFKKTGMMILFLMTIIVQSIYSQTVVGLDNWFNHETDSKTGKAFHYLWSDKEFSGYSEWGEIFTSKGAEITTISKPLASVLKKISIYIIVDPDSITESAKPNYISSDDIATIKKWVENGGVLAVLANDAPNCEFKHLNNLMTEFGMFFKHVTLHKVTGDNFEMGASGDLPAHPLFKGVSKIYIKEVSDIKLSGTAKPLLTEDGKVLIAENSFGKGYVFAIGDPWIYNEYIDHDRLPESFGNRKAAENLTDILLAHARKK